jgi:hypothetical protein
MHLQASEVLRYSGSEDERSPQHQGQAKLACDLPDPLQSGTRTSSQG